MLRDLQGAEARPLPQVPAPKAPGLILGGSQLDSRAPVSKRTVQPHARLSLCSYTEGGSCPLSVALVTGPSCANSLRPDADASQLGPHAGVQGCSPVMARGQPLPLLPHSPSPFLGLC